jgi:hypothetical protein
MTDRYFVAIPGSADPPRGPLAISDIESQYRTGVLSKGASICKVGDSTWIDLSSVFPAEPPPAPPRRELPHESARGGSISEKLADGARRYAKLTKVADGLRGTGSAFEFLGVAVFVGGIAAAFFALSKESVIAAVPLGVGAVLFGPALYSLGTLIAAAGEALLALRDIAINTRVTAEAVE